MFTHTIVILINKTTSSVRVVVGYSVITVLYLNGNIRRTCTSFSPIPFTLAYLRMISINPLGHSSLCCNTGHLLCGVFLAPHSHVSMTLQPPSHKLYNNFFYYPPAHRADVSDKCLISKFCLWLLRLVYP